MNLPQPSASFKILLAEDDPDDRFFFQSALNEIPLATSLTMVRDGEELMKYLSDNLNNLPTVLFLDLSMPRKTGFECLSEIKGSEKLKDIPVVMFSTSYTHGVDLEQTLMGALLKMGALEYIRKPGDIEQLKQVIHKMLLRVMEKGV